LKVTLAHVQLKIILRLLILENNYARLRDPPEVIVDVQFVFQDISLQKWRFGEHNCLLSSYARQMKILML
jgi:hypothetical protein